ncbi:MAG: hypothetical protein ABW079_12455 [Sedimenticola sp.]
MKLFISRVPENTSSSELRLFIERGLNKGIRKLPVFSCVTVKSCRVVRLVDQRTGVHELHGIASIESYKSIDYVTGRLTGRKLAGKPVSVHEYQRRRSTKDRRILYIDPDTLNKPDCREKERRRSKISASTEIT